MPRKDRDKIREADRERKRLTRAAAGSSTPRPPRVRPEIRLKVVGDAIRILEDQIAEVLAEPGGAFERARVVVQLVSVSLRAIEAGDLAERIEALERQRDLKGAGIVRDERETEPDERQSEEQSPAA